MPATITAPHPAQDAPAPLQCRSVPDAGRSLSDVRTAKRQTAARSAEYQAALTEIFFSFLIASGVFGSVTVSKPFLKWASILSASTPSGSWKQRRNEP